MITSDREKILALLQIATGVGILAFWLLFFTVGLAPAKPPACYFAFEHAFPLSDTILALALLASGRDILRGGWWGRKVSLVCAGGLLFLGIIDFSFTAQNGGFTGAIVDAMQSAIISLWCIVLALLLITAQGLLKPGQGVS
jgi:hypothetical protein